MDDQEGSRRFLFELDPPQGRRKRVFGVVLWLAVAVMLAIPLRLLLIDDGAASQIAAAPAATGLAGVCSRLDLPALLEQVAALAYPVWTTVCDLARR